MENKDEHLCYFSLTKYLVKQPAQQCVGEIEKNEADKRQD